MLSWLLCAATKRLPRIHLQTDRLNLAVDSVCPLSILIPRSISFPFPIRTTSLYLQTYAPHGMDRQTLLDYRQILLPVTVDTMKVPNFQA